MGRIHHLSDALINQIAAGEVVERPASVVKELCENAVDAGAACVRVRLAGGGLELISVVDDGHGMSREDALLCLERHATSKLVDAEGLSAIVTKGFRGEALPSIASVSRLTLTTSEPGAERGSHVELAGGGPLTVADAAPFGGTRVEVADLFFNTPARRKFLKREATELGHCEEAVVRLALAHPEIGFFLEHEGRSIISSPAATVPQERIGALLGTEVLPHLLKVDERRLGVSVSGFIASPELTLPTARGLYTFVNHRYVRDRGVTSAVQRAYQDTLPPGRQPMTVLFLEVDPAAVDVNVHPQKLEVRFAEPRAIQEVLAVAIGGALKGAPWRQGVPQSTQQVHAHYALAVERFLARAQPGESSPTEGGLPLAHDGGRLAFGTARPSINEAPPPGFFSQLRFLGELARRFWLCEGLGGTLVVIDPRAVKERLAFGRLRERAHDRRSPAVASAGSTTSSLFSATVELPASELDGVLAKASWLAQLGLELEAFGGTTVLLRGAPPELEAAGLSDAAWAALLLELASIEPSAADALDQGLGRLAAAAVPEGWRAATHAEVHAQLQALDEADFSGAGRRARIVVHQLPLLELEALTR